MVQFYKMEPKVCAGDVAAAEFLFAAPIDETMLVSELKQIIASQLGAGVDASRVRVRPAVDNQAAKKATATATATAAAEKEAVVKEGASDGSNGSTELDDVVSLGSTGTTAARTVAGLKMLQASPMIRDDETLLAATKKKLTDGYVLAVQVLPNPTPRFTGTLLFLSTNQAALATKHATEPAPRYTGTLFI
jgi:hypothetical protein